MKSLHPLFVFFSLVRRHGQLFSPMLLMTAQRARGRSSVRPCPEQFGRLSTHASRLRTLWDMKRGRVGGSVHDHNAFFRRSLIVMFLCSV